MISTKTLTTTLNVPPQSVSQTTILIYEPLPYPLHEFKSDYIYLNRAFRMYVYQDGTFHPDFTFNKPITITLAYTQVNITGSVVLTGSSTFSGTVVITEDEVGLYQWFQTYWRLATRTCQPPSQQYVNKEENWLQIGICQTGEFALFSVDVEHIYLPLIIK